MKNKALIFFWFSFLFLPLTKAQNNTFSPYSRYGLGELSSTTLAHNTGMGGAYIALRPDSTMPIFINTGNPASYSLIKLTSLEVGGSYLYSNIVSNTSTQKKWGTNFAYGTLGFPIKSNGGACIGIMPYSHVGYDTQSKMDEIGIGNVDYKYSGSGSLNKVFIGYGVMPFQKSLRKFRKHRLYIADSLKTLTKTQYAVKEFGNKVLSDFSIGLNVNYIFGNVQNTSRVVYPNSLLYNNTYRENIITIGDFTGNFGAQTAITIDSIWNRKERKSKIDFSIKQLKELALSPEQIAKEIKRISDSIPLQKRAFKEKVKFTFGYFMGLNNTLKVNYNTAAFNYIVNSSGQELIRDTAYFNQEQKGSIQLPLEQGFGIGFKKGERLNIVADVAITNWQNFKYLNEINTLKDNYRTAIGFNFVPEKYAAGRGSFLRKVNYRFGVSYQSGFINLNNTVLSNYTVSAGVGLPVGIGRLSSMINISAQYGIMGTKANGLMRENYWRINFGFTFCDRWFQKFRYD